MEDVNVKSSLETCVKEEHIDDSPEETSADDNSKSAQNNGQEIAMNLGLKTMEDDVKPCLEPSVQEGHFDDKPEVKVTDNDSIMSKHDGLSKALVDAKKLIDDADDAGDIMKNRNQELTEELQRKNQELEAKDDQLQRKTAECDGIKKEFDDFKGNLRRATEDGALQAFMRLIATVNTNLGGDPDNAVIPQQQLPNPVVTENRSGFSGYSHTGITTANNTPNYSTHGIPAPPPWPPSYEAPLYDAHGAPSSSTGRFPFTPPKRARTDGVQQDNYGGNSSNPNHLQPR